MEEDSESWLVKIEPFYFDPCKQVLSNWREPIRQREGNSDGTSRVRMSEKTVCISKHKFGSKLH